MQTKLADPHVKGRRKGKSSLELVVKEQLRYDLVVKGGQNDLKVIMTIPKITKAKQNISQIVTKPVPNL